MVEDVADGEVLTINTHFQIYQTEESAGSQREGPNSGVKRQGFEACLQQLLVIESGEVNHLA